MGVTGIAAAGRTRRTGCGARAGRGCKLAERWPRAAGLHKAAGARVRRARSRAERRAGLAGTLPLFCTQRWASAKMQDAACRHGPAGSRELETFGKATLHGQGRALAYTSRSLGRCGLVMEAPARMVAGCARRGGQQARGKLVYRARWRRWQESPAGVAGHRQVAGSGLGSRL